MFLPLIPVLLRYKGIESSLIDKFSWAGYFSLGFFVLSFFILLSFDILWGVWLGVSRLITLMANSGYTEGVQSDTRRLFISETARLGLLAVSGGLSLWGMYQARKKATIFHISIPIEDLPPDLEGFRIVQLSDIHVGPTIKRDYLQRIVDQTSEIKADMIVLTGDLVDGSAKYLSDQLTPLSDLKAKYGKYFITGNHEYYSGVKQWIPVVKSLGFVPLINENRVITKGNGTITLAGITDITAKQMDPENAPNPEMALQGAPSKSVKVLLAHQPGAIKKASQLGFDLQLSGHTHGGQFKPFNLAVERSTPYIAGLYKHNDTWIYVNRGTGYWGPPLRLGIPSEITVLILTGKMVGIQ